MLTHQLCTQIRNVANARTPILFYTLTRSHCVLLAGFEGRLEWIFISSLVFVPDAYINFCPFCFSYDLRLQGARSYAFLPVLNSSAQRLSSSKCHRLETGVEFFWFVLLCYSLSLCLTFSLLPSCFEIQNVVFVSCCSRGNSFLQSTRCGVCLRISLRKLRMERNDAIKATMEGKGQGKEKEKATKIKKKEKVGRKTKKKQNLDMATFFFCYFFHSISFFSTPFECVYTVDSEEIG